MIDPNEFAVFGVKVVDVACLLARLRIARQNPPQSELMMIDEARSVIREIRKGLLLFTAAEALPETR